MAVVATICPECGKAVKTDSTKKADICKHCGEAFIVADAIAAADGPSRANDKITPTPKAQAAGRTPFGLPQDELKFWEIEGALLIKYKGKKREVCIPDGVTELAESSISADTVIIPPSVKRINANAIYADKIIIQSNPDIIVGRCGNYKCEVIFEGEFGAIADEWSDCGSMFPTLRFDALDEKAALAKQPDLYDRTRNSIVLFKGETEVRSTQWEQGTDILFTVNADGKATILRYRFIASANVWIADNDFRKIDGYTIKAFRNKNVQKQFFDFLIHTKLLGTQMTPAPQACLPLGLTYLPRDLKLTAVRIMLPATIEYVEPFAVYGWKRVEFYDDLIINGIPINYTKIKRIEENAFYMGSSSPSLTYQTVLIENEPDFIHETNCKFVEYNGFEVGGGLLPLAIPAQIYLGKKNTYIIEVDERCGELTATATRTTPRKTYTEKISSKQKKHTITFPSDCTAGISDEKGKLIGALVPAPKVNVIKKSMLGYKLTVN